MRIGLYQMSQETDTFNPLPHDDGRLRGVRPRDRARDARAPPRTEHDRRLPRGGGSVRSRRRDGRARPRPGGRRRPDHDRRARASSRTGSGRVSRAPDISTGWRCTSTARARRRASTTSRAGCSRSRGGALPPGVPIVLTIDHHANVTQAMVDGCDALVGYRTQPHDPFETAVASTEPAAPDRRRRGPPDDGLAQDPAPLAPGAVPDLGRADEDLVRPRAGAGARARGALRSRRSRCSRGWTWTRPAGRRSW